MTFHGKRASAYLILVKIRNSAPNMSQLDVLYESDNGSLVGSPSDDSEIENGHHSVFTVKHSTETSYIRQNMCKCVRLISSM